MIPEPDATAEMAAVRELGAYVLALQPGVLAVDPQAAALNEAVRAAIIEGQRLFALRTLRAVDAAGGTDLGELDRAVLAAIAELEAKEETMSEETVDE